MVRRGQSTQESKYGFRSRRPPRQTEITECLVHWSEKARDKVEISCDQFRILDFKKWGIRRCQMEHLGCGSESWRQHDVSERNMMDGNGEFERFETVVDTTGL